MKQYVFSQMRTKWTTTIFVKAKKNKTSILVTDLSDQNLLMCGNSD